MPTTLKLHKYFALALAGAFLAVIEIFTAWPVFRFLFLSVVLFLALANYYNRRYLVAQQKYTPWVLVRFSLLVLAAIAIYLLLPTAALRGVFLLSAFFVIFAVEFMIGEFAENLLINETLAAGFGLFAGLCGAAQYFPDWQSLPVYLWHWHLFDWQFSLQPFYGAVMFAVSLLLARSFFEFVPRPNRDKWVAAILLSLFSSELFWVSGFLPLHFSALALVLLSIFYFMLILTYYHFFHTLTLKKIQYHLALAVAACFIAILLTPWTILS